MSDEDVPVDVARKIQLTRNVIVSLLGEPQISEVVKGGVVRVLLELQSGDEDYRVGFVLGTETGPSYAGYTHDPNVYTSTYLSLELPGNLSGINGTLFQLNSISNSPISQAEWSEWVRNVHPRRQAVQAMRDKEIELRPILERAPRARHRMQTNAPASTVTAAPPALGPAATVVNPSHGSRHSSPPAADSKANTNQDLRATVTNGGGGDESKVDLDDSRDINDDMPSEAQLRRQVIEELREKSQVFPKNTVTMATPLLRMTERDLIEYLDRVRERISASRPNCVVCMDRPPTVIILPCKHQVLCRLCATQVKGCPVCRETAVDLFEPVEI